MKKRSTCRIGWLILGIMMTTASSIWAATWYVSTDGSDGNAGTNWATAKATIQAGVDASSGGDTVIVGAGTYVISNEILVTKGITLKSAAGVRTTTMDGVDYQNRCLKVASSNAVVQGFTVTRGGNVDFGGGIHIGAGIVQNCEVRGNRAIGGPVGGAGVRLEGGSLVNCLVTGNTATWSGSPSSVQGAGVSVDGGSVINCTITRNIADHYTVYGSGLYVASDGNVLNTIVYANTSVPPGKDQWYADSGVLSHCCAAPLPPGTGNITNSPLFESTDDCHLQPGSPCIDAGFMAAATGSDFDGKDRIGRPDIGAYEFVAETNSNFVIGGYQLATSPPEIEVLSVSNRFRSNLVDINYRLTDADSGTVQVRGYATTKPACDPGVTYMDTVFPISTLAEGTQNEYGDAVVPTNATKHLVWDAGTDIGQSVAGIRLEFMVSDTSGLPISRSYVSVPADTNGPSFQVNAYAGATSNFHLQRALLWAWLKGLASRSGMDLLAVGGAYDGQTVAESGRLTAVGRSWLAENMPGARLATAQEIQRAREATTPGKVTQWLSYYRPGRKVNEFGVDTTESDAWYLVKE